MRVLKSRVLWATPRPGRTDRRTDERTAPFPAASAAEPEELQPSSYTSSALPDIPDGGTLTYRLSALQRLPPLTSSYGKNMKENIYIYIYKRRLSTHEGAGAAAQGDSHLFLQRSCSRVMHFHLWGHTTCRGRCLVSATCSLDPSEAGACARSRYLSEVIVESFLRKRQSHFVN